MAFDSVTLLMIAVLLLLAVGVPLIRRGGGAAGSGAAVWSGAACLGQGLGLALVMASGGEIHGPLRVFGHAALTLAFGLHWAAARRAAGRGVPFEPVVAGAVAWQLLSCGLDPAQGWRSAFVGAAVALYGLATAREYVQADPPAPRLAGLFALNGAFFLIGALLVPWEGLLARGWGIVLGPETALFALALRSLARPPAAVAAPRPAAPPGEVLEDPLTGIGNFLALLRSGGALLDAALGAGRPAALLLMDLDAVGPLNARDGPAAADRLLVAFARMAHDYLPPSALVCRLDGNAFAALLPGADPARADAVADEIRSLFAHLAVPGPHGAVRTTVSIGIASAGPGDDIRALVDAAARCLDRAKAEGRNRVVAGAPRLSAA